MGIVSNLWANEGRDDISPTSTLPIHEHDPLLFSKSLIFFNVFIRVVFYFPCRVFEEETSFILLRMKALEEAVKGVP